MLEAQLHGHEVCAHAACPQPSNSHSIATRNAAARRAAVKVRAEAWPKAVAGMDLAKYSEHHPGNACCRGVQITIFMMRRSPAR